MRKGEIIVLLMVLGSFILGIFFYQQMPERIASHWNAQGQADGYMSKFWGLFLLPSILLGFALLFIAVPRIDPLKANIEKFRKYYEGFIILFFIFLLSLHLNTILWNVGIQISPIIFISIGMGMLYIFLGILCENAKRNWFIGIRTPWTLSSEKVWDKTHKIAGKLMKIVGVITLSGVLLQRYAIILAVLPLVLVSTYLIVYSYLEYKKETK